MAQYVLELPRWDSRDQRGRREVWDALHANQRGGRSAGPSRRQMEAYRARLVKSAIHAVATLALDARIPESDHLTVELVWVPDGPRRARDEDNLWPLLKVFCDALARGPAKRGRGGPGLDLVPDDDRRHMAKLPPRIEDRANHAPGLWLYVTTREAPPCPSPTAGTADTAEALQLQPEPAAAARRSSATGMHSRS